MTYLNDSQELPSGQIKISPLEPIVELHHGLLVIGQGEDRISMTSTQAIEVMGSIVRLIREDAYSTGYVAGNL